jgi:SNF2 family DNA or RNA helicase
MKIFDQLMTKLLKQKRKVLVFSFFKIMLDILVDYLDMKDIKYVRLDGEYLIEDREKSI